MLRNSLFLGLVTMPAMGTALAADHLSYNFVEAAYGRSQTSGFEDQNSWNAGGSLALDPRFHAFASVIDYDVGSGASATLWRVGLGANLEISKTVDFIGRLAYANGRVSVAGVGNASKSGYVAGAGIRAAISPSFELEGGVDYLKLQDIDSETDVSGTLRYHFTDALDGTVGLSVSDGSPSTNTWLIGLRYNFQR